MFLVAASVIVFLDLYFWGNPLQTIQPFIPVITHGFFMNTFSPMGEKCQYDLLNLSLLNERY